MKKILVLTLFISAVFATDYSSMSLEELQSLKGSVPVEQRSAFQQAMRAKMSELTPQQRQEFNNANKNAKGVGQRLQDGSGSGGMYKGSHGMGKGGSKGR